MFQSSLYYTDNGVDDIYLCCFSVKHDEWLHNLLPNYYSSITPIELLASNKADHCNLSRSHVWGCPVFVLEPKLQNYQKIPKWNCSSLLGQFLGFS